MANITVVVSKVRAHLPTGITFDHTDITVKDSAGVTSTQAVNGKEVPAWTGTFTVADGAGSASATDMDSVGNPIGIPVSVNFDTLAGTFPSSNGITITVA